MNSIEIRTSIRKFQVAVIAAGYPETEAAAKDKYDPERIHMGKY